MRIINRMRKQWATYWPPVGADEYGQPTFGTPIELKVRWDDVTEAYFNKMGESRSSESQVFVGQDVEEGGVLWLGRLTEVTDPAKPFAQKKAFQIQKFEKVPTLRATQFLRVAWL